MIPGSDDDLRDRLAGLDPVPASTPVDPASGPRAHELMERAMTSTETTPTQATPTRPRRPLILGVAAAAVIVAGVGVYSLGGTTPVTPDPGVTASAPLTLSVADSDPSASCLRLDAAGLARFPVAFAGTVTAVDGPTVSLDVTRWYQGGTAETVRLRGTGGSPALTGVEFTAGEQVLITASDGQVSGCGYSNEASPQLSALYDEAFGG